MVSWVYTGDKALVYNHCSELCVGNREGAVGRKREARSGTYQSIKINVLTIPDIIKVDIP